MRKHRRIEEHCQSKTRYSPALSAFYQIWAKFARPFAFSDCFSMGYILLSCGVSDLKTSVNQSWQEKTELWKNMKSSHCFLFSLVAGAQRAFVFWDPKSSPQTVLLQKKLFLTQFKWHHFSRFGNWTTTKSNITLVHIFLPCHTLFWNPNSTSEVGPSIVCRRNVPANLDWMACDCELHQDPGRMHYVVPRKLAWIL